MENKVRYLNSDVWAWSFWFIDQQCQQYFIIFELRFLIFKIFNFKKLRFLIQAISFYNTYDKILKTNQLKAKAVTISYKCLKRSV